MKWPLILTILDHSGSFVFGVGRQFAWLSAKGIASLKFAEQR
jgi:hypothetical protein